MDFSGADMNMKVEKCGETPIILMGVVQQQKMRLFQKKLRDKENLVIKMSEVI